MILQVRSDREFTAIERGITDAVDAFVRHHFQRDEVTARTRDNDIGAHDFHGDFLEWHSLRPMLPYTFSNS